MSRKRRNFNSEFKAKVALDALRGEQTTAELAKKYDVHPNMITAWKKELLDRAGEVFEKGNAPKDDGGVETAELYRQIGQLKVENDFLSRGARKASLSEKRALIERGHEKLSVARQCELLDINRSTLYYKPRTEGADNATLRRLIDEQYLETPFYGSRRMTEHLRDLGHQVNRKRVQRLMRQMGIEAIYPKKKRTTIRNPEHKIYPYLLRNVDVTRPNQAWAADITYVSQKQGFMYLVAIIDWFGRKVLAFSISNTMEASFCIETLKEALETHGKPEIFNTDQGSQFTDGDFTAVLKSAGVQISMDGRGRCQDNIFIERLWRSVKYEYIYLNAVEGGSNLRSGLSKYFEWYNQERPHQGLGYRKPDEVYYEELLNQTVA
jgi:putative transposase